MNAKLNRFSFGVGDRFAHQAKAQLKSDSESRRIRGYNYTGLE